MADTHINAYYTELQKAQADLSSAQIRVNELEAHIAANGGELPVSADETPTPEAPKRVRKTQKAPAKRDAKGHFIKVVQKP